MTAQLEEALRDYAQTIEGNAKLYGELEPLKDITYRFQEMMMVYKAAIREVRTKLEVLNDEFQVRNQRNPIRYIKHRVKKPESILEKLHRRGLEISLDSMIQNLTDIAGVRVVCSYESDIYDIAHMLTKQDDVRLLLTKDYIKHPKENGYRSLHILIEIPVFFSDRKQFVKVEVQIRTMAMDFWASLEHQLRYKSEEDRDEEIVNALRECAEDIHATDKKMQSIYEKIKSDHMMEENMYIDKYNDDDIINFV